MSDIERCQGCGYSEERHPMEFPEAPTCDTFQPVRTDTDN